MIILRGAVMSCHCGCVVSQSAAESLGPSVCASANRGACVALTALFMGCQGGNWAKQSQLLLDHPEPSLGTVSCCHGDAELP